MPVFENFPYTNFHDLNLDWILSTVRKLEDRMDVFDAGADEGIKGARIKNHSRYYIDCVDGNDKNPGTAAEPFKTLDKFLDLSDKVSELRCYIVKAGTYPITKGDNFANVHVHIYATVPDVVIDFRPTSAETQISGYSCHWNLQGPDSANKLTITGHDRNGNLLDTLYFDNSLMSFTNCEIDVYYRAFGGLVVMSACDILRVNFYGAIFNISDGTQVNNTDPAATPFVFTNCIGRILGSVTSEELLEVGSVPYLISNTSYIICGTALVPSLTNSYDIGLQVKSGGAFFCTDSRIEACAARAVNGNDLDPICLIVTDHGTRTAESVRYNNGTLEYWSGTAWVSVV